jgi:hypothetical protein
MSKEVNNQADIIRKFIQQELELAKRHKKRYGWICKHFKYHDEGRISVCKNLLMFIDTELR